MKKKYLTWKDVYNRLKSTVAPYEPKTVFYGVPTGGMILTGFLKTHRVTYDVNSADVIIDDLTDSGETEQWYREKYPDKFFVTLFDSKKDFNGDWVVFPWEADHPSGEQSVEGNITRILQTIGEDPDREGLRDTPKRVVKSWKELYAGYNQDPADILTTFEAGTYDQIVLLKDIELHSTCEHHMLPFYGKAHVAYIPNDRVIGISKLARLVEIYARRLQIQERIGEQVTKDLMEFLKPKGAACIIEAKHMCMCARGVGKQNSEMLTSSVKGQFLESASAKNELLQLLK